MNNKQLELLETIAGGFYLPIVRGDFSTLAYLYREGLISYGWKSVEITEKGKETLWQTKTQAVAQ